MKIQVVNLKLKIVAIAKMVKLEVIHLFSLKKMKIILAVAIVIDKKLRIISKIIKIYNLIKKNTNYI